MKPSSWRWTRRYPAKLAMRSRSAGRYSDCGSKEDVAVTAKIRQAGSGGRPPIGFSGASGGGDARTTAAARSLHDVVAERAGHDPATLLRNYATRTKKADTAAAEAIGIISVAALRRAGR